jgi:3-hydroxyacyl-[acyl-carrier-protein] dehydratase
MQTTINIQKRLHHRKPYLFIDSVMDHSKEHIIAKKTFTAEDFFIDGHFPNAPVIPGAIMQEMTTQAAGLLLTEHYSPIHDYDSNQHKGHAIGVLRAIHNAKYSHFAKPNQELIITVTLIQSIDNAFRFKAKIECNNQKIMSNEFTLVNISDQFLY